EQPSGGRAHAEHRKESAADPDLVRPARLAAAREIHPLAAPRGDLAEAFLPRADLFPLRVRDPARTGHTAVEASRAPLPVGLDDLQGRELLRRGNGKRAEAHGVEELEDGRVRAGPESERKDGDGRERRVLEHLTDGVLEVAAEAREEPGGRGRARS